MSEWQHKDVWVKRCKDFTIEVSRHELRFPGGFFEMGPHRWCVYAYVYKDHPFFKDIDEKGGLFQRVNNYLPLHCGCSFFHAHKNEKGEITSYQIGADYAHLGDELYTHLPTKEDAGAVFADAEELERYLEKGELT